MQTANQLPVRQKPKANKPFQFEAAAIRPWLRGHWPQVVVTAAPLLLFAPFLLGRVVLYWGTPLLQFYPWRQLAFEMMRAGHWPLWNPYVGNGAPLLANYQSAVFYPPNWLGMALPLEYSFSWLVTLHLIWAGLGMVYLGRALGLLPLGQAVAGLAFGLSQYLVARAGFLSINAVAAWLPWIIWCVERASTAAVAQPAVRGRLFLALSSCVAMQLLAGHAQLTWYTLLLAGAWALWRLLSQATVPGRLRMAAAGTMLAAVVLGVGLAALQLLPTAELMRESSRAEAAEYEFATTYSFSPWRLLTLLAPDLLGNPARGQYLGYGNYWEDAVYVGVLPLLLGLGTAMGAVSTAVQKKKSDPAMGLALFLVIVMAASLVLGLGRNTPVFPFFYRYVPTFNLFQAPTRIMLWFVFALALLAGLGADRWTSPEGRRRHRIRLGVTGSLSIILVGTAFLFALPASGQLATQFRIVSTSLVLLGLALFLSGALALLRRYLPASIWTGLVVGFIGMDLLYANAGLNPGAPPDLYRRMAKTEPALTAAVGQHRLFQYPDDEYALKFEKLLSFKSFGGPELAHATRDAQLPNAAFLSGLASANNFEPLISQRYADLMQVISDTRSIQLLRLMDVGAIASTVPLDLEAIPGAETEDVGFYAVPDGLGRAWAIENPRLVRAHDGRAELAAIADPGFDPAAMLVLEMPEPAGQTGDEGGAGLPSRTVMPETLVDGPAIQTYSVRLAADGYLVVADTHYPGWQAMVDGQPAALLRADYAFRAVQLDAGEHIVTFEYRPRSFRYGLWVSGAAAIIWMLAAILWRQR